MSSWESEDGYLLDGGILIQNDLESCWNEQCDR